MPVPFVDAFGRRVKYLRLSVTDRCDLRCRYCMSEAMTFLPSKELLTFDELERVARCVVLVMIEIGADTGAAAPVDSVQQAAHRSPRAQFEVAERLLRPCRKEFF